MNLQPKNLDSQMKKKGSIQESMNKSAGEDGMTSGWWVREIKGGKSLSMMGKRCFV